MNLEEVLSNKEKVREVPNRASVSPKVSVCVMAYNHEPYIRACLNSILMQEVDFEFEILLGEDCSSDSTRAICLEYAERYPDKIRLFLHKRENVIYIDGLPTGRFNYLNNLRNARGKYIALCDGDDYWIDSQKLQRQLDFMEANPDYVLCGGKWIIKTPDGLISSPFVEGYDSKNNSIGTKDFISFYNVPIHASTAFFRRRSMIGEEGFDSWEKFTKFTMADIPLFFILSTKGDVHRMPIYFSVYNKDNQSSITNIHSVIDKREGITYLLDFISQTPEGRKNLKVVRKMKRFLIALIEKERFSYLQKIWFLFNYRKELGYSIRDTLYIIRTNGI